jgi:peptidoglycan/LPS O-acetylase OafA/YrhL
MEMLAPSTAVKVAAPRPGLPRHIPALDGLRGLAILLVLFDHYLPCGDSVASFRGVSLGHAALNLATRIPRSSWSGVNLFFVLSGFLITGILWRARNGDAYFRNFYMRRFLRIFPLYYATLFVLFVAIPGTIGYRSSEAHLVLANQSSFWLYTVNLTMARYGDFIFGNGPLQLNHFWSLSIEEQFYLAWPLIVFCLNRRALFWLCGGITAFAIAVRCALAWHGASWATIFVFTPSQCDALAIGAAIALLPGDLARFVPAARWTCLACAAALLLFAFTSPAFCLDQHDLRMQTVGYTLLAFFFGSLLILVIQAKPASIAARFWTHPALRFLGKYSYGIYVLHEVLRPVFDWLFPLSSVQLWMHGHGLGDIVHFAMVSTISIAAAVMSYHLFEVHFLSLKRLFPYRERARAMEVA